MAMPAEFDFSRFLRIAVWVVACFLIILGIGTSAVGADVVSFRNDVMPIFFRNNCNSGGCHGAAAGKDGFRLSLFGYDPAGDYYRITQQLPGRRIDVEAPEQSLLVLKAIGAVPHTGGRLFGSDSPHYTTLVEWIRQGGLDDAAAVAQVTGLAIEPSSLRFRGSGSQPLRVVARLSDGTSRDVTKLALYLTNNKTVADVEKDGVVVAGRHGGTDVFARFSRFTAGASVVVLPEKDDFEWPDDIVPRNFIDAIVFEKLHDLRIAPAPLASDSEYLRRVFFDVIGMPPTEQEVVEFLADVDPGKRDRIVDALLQRPEYADHWANRWADWLKVTGSTYSGQGTDTKAADAFTVWLADQFRANLPLDEFLRTLVFSRGSNILQPETNFYTMMNAREPKAIAQDVAQLCLGTRIQCAECHNHPFDRWTQDDYYGFVSFFTGVRQKKGSEPREYYTFNDNQAPPAKHMLDGRPMPPKYLGGDLPATTGKDPRQELAAWLTSPENELFARSMANRIWAGLFGRGIVEPVDDLRITNPPSNPRLFEALGDKLASYGFDQKRLIRDIAMSRTYQSSSRVNASNREDDRQFSHAAVRRFGAVTAIDAISAITGVKTPWKHFPGNYWATQIYHCESPAGGSGPQTYFLSCFGQSPRVSVDASSDSRTATLSQSLHLIVGDTLHDKLRSSTVIPALMKQHPGTDPSGIIASLFLRTLGRPPSQGEQDTFRSVSADPPARVDYERLWWALFNSTEFMHQH